MSSSILKFLIFLSFCQFNLVFGYERIKLKDVQALTFYRDRYTIGRKPIPQLSCQSGYSLCKNQPAVVQCTNVGWDGIDAQWKCNANLDKNVKFNKLSVNCEGFDHLNDPFIIAGSCGLEYELAHRDPQSNNKYEYDDSTASSLPFWIFIGFVAVFVFIMFCKSSDESTREREGYNYRGTPSAPPPPAGFRSDFYTDAPPKYSASYPDYTNNQQQSSNSGPGFFSGLGLGALGGYLFSNRSSRNQYGSSTSPPLFTDYNYYRPSNTANNYYQDDLNTSSNDTYQATGFTGGTKRR